MKRHKGQYVASKPFGHWVPSHVGSGLPTSERKALLRHREKECAKETSKATESIQCFWLAHAVVDKSIPPQAVQAHLAVFARLQSEFGLGFAVQYERYLHAAIMEDIANSQLVDFMAVLATIKLEIVQKLSAQGVRKFEPRSWDRAGPPRGSLPPSRVQQAPKGQGKVRPNEVVAAGKGAAPERRTPLCLAHDMANGKLCPDASNGKCRSLHLDTRTPEEAKRFKAALFAVERRSSRGKGR